MAEIGNEQLKQDLGRQQIGYTRGLPKGVSMADTEGLVAVQLTDVVPTSTFITSGTLIYDPTGPALKVWTGEAWVTTALT